MWVDYDVTNWFLTSKYFYRSPFSKWPPQYRKYSTLFDFNNISYVGRLWCPEMIPDIEIFLPVAIFRLWSLPNRPQTTGLKNKLKATFEIEQCWIFTVLWWPFWKWRPVEIFQCRIMMSRNDSWHRKISTGRHFQNGHHNTAQIQHC
jgi:hypothetical protein